ncbi:MAG TPA: DNA primase [Candidatus Saccharibacteria bacterium]|nr:DNA primase [Candidatus Saccharibacteria bacterium]
MQDAKEEVRARLNIEDVIGEYVQLKRAGRNFKGLSPFSGEKTPSFMVSPDKHIWHDFSSGKGGDIFSFVMEVEGMDFRQALEHLARRAGVDLSIYQSARSGEIAKKKKRLLEAHRLASQYYQQSLLSNQHALQYVFKKRGLSKEIVRDFQIGYAPSSGDALVQFLTKKGFSKSELADAGLTNRFGGDLFRGRMMVALMDSGGQVIGFTARIIEDDPNAPKYLNTPQTLLYDKGRHVFGLSQAKEAIRSHDYTVIVEGNMDVISSHQAGETMVVATAGTAMTEHHLKALSRLSAQVRLAFDGDKAGIAATERAIPIAQTVGVELTIITLPGEAKDPDELIQQDVALWRKAIESAEPAVDWLLGQYESRVDMKTAAGKRQYTSAGLNLVRALSDPVDQDHYVQVMARTTGASIEALREKMSQGTSEAPVRLRPVAATAKVDDPAADTSRQDDLLAALLIDPAARQQLHASHVLLFEGEARQDIAAYLAEHQEMIEDTPQLLQKHDTYVKILLLRADTRYAAWDAKDRSLEVARLLRQCITEHSKLKREQLIDELRDAEDQGDDERSNAIRAELNTLIKEIKHG